MINIYLTAKETHNFHYLFNFETIIKFILNNINHFMFGMTGAQWLSGIALDSRPKGRGLEPHRRHCVVSLSKNINPSLVLVQPRRTRPFITERLLMGRKESNQMFGMTHTLVPGHYTRVSQK